MIGVIILEICLMVGGFYAIYRVGKKLWSIADVKQKTEEMEVVQKKVKMISELESRASKLPGLKKRIKNFTDL